LIPPRTFFLWAPPFPFFLFSVIWLKTPGRHPHLSPPKPLCVFPHFLPPNPTSRTPLLYDNEHRGSLLAWVLDFYCFFFNLQVYFRPELHILFFSPLLIPFSCGIPFGPLFFSHLTSPLLKASPGQDSAVSLLGCFQPPPTNPPGLFHGPPNDFFFYRHPPQMLFFLPYTNLFYKIILNFLPFFPPSSPLGNFFWV